jgi:hypothetical protein
MTEQQIRELFTEMANRAPASSRIDPRLLRRGRARLRWRRAGLAGASAVATAAAIATSLAISSAIQQRPAGPGGDASDAAVIAKVPPYFVALPLDKPGPAVAVATASGAVLGTVTPPSQDPAFVMAAAGGDGRTFVFAASPAPGKGPARFYRLVLSRSGHPGHLAPLPLPPETSSISGLAVSPDGSKLAVSVFGPGDARTGARIQVFSLATGTGREWVWPGKGWIGWTVPLGTNEFDARSLSWAADSRTLLFEEHTDTRASLNAQARLLDTTAPGGSLLAASTHVPIPGAELSPYGIHKHPPFQVTGPLMLTGDGTKIVAPTSRHITHGPGMLASAITEFSVRTGLPVQVLHRQQLSYDNGAAVLWVNKSGTVLIAGRPVARPKSYNRDSVIGVQAPAGFVPLPAGAQHYYLKWQPDW